jgi:hypothetical protein
MFFTYMIYETLLVICIWCLSEYVTIVVLGRQKWGILVCSVPMLWKNCRSANAPSWTWMVGASILFQTAMSSGIAWLTVRLSSWDGCILGGTQGHRRACGSNLDLPLLPSKKFKQESARMKRNLIYLLIRFVNTTRTLCWDILVICYTVRIFMSRVHTPSVRN